MSVGGLFLVISVALWMLTALGVHTIPTADAVAHACLALGILLGGLPFGPFWTRG